LGLYGGLVIEQALVKNQFVISWFASPDFLGKAALTPDNPNVRASLLMENIS
jgi:hypothetical protein